MKSGRPLTELEHSGEFVGRHIGPRATDREEMLAVLGVGSLDALIDEVVPATIRDASPPGIGNGLTEVQALDKLRAMAAQNEAYTSLIGMGHHNCHTPGVILRNVLENPAWYTAYTPYQAEISQGRLEAMINFQTMVCDLTGMELANASLLDEATAAAEAMALCRRMSKSSSTRFFVAADCHPQTITVLRTRAEPIGIEIVVGDPRVELTEVECFGVLLQYPGTGGQVYDYAQTVAQAHAKQALVTVAADLLSLTLLKPPGEFDVDVTVGSAQRFGVPLFYGGPHAAFLATRESFKRAIPGRLVGVSVDSRGDTAYRMALQTREQHIRREKATSNVCTAQALLAVIAGLYAVYHGADGLTRIAERVHRLACILATGLERLGFSVGDEPFFDTLTVHTGDRTVTIHEAARGQRFNLRDLDASRVGIALDETVTRADVERLWSVFAGGATQFTVADIDAEMPSRIPEALRRSSAFLTHPVFHSHRSETEMLRYLRSLADKDLALDRAMIPLGSCTMKLNATSELAPVSWPEFSNLHPFAPPDQTRGYAAMTAELEDMLCRLSGYDAVSLQPNAGSQGEFAGLLAIRAYHRSRGEGQRDICLIPSSAHGTNPASAQMAGLKVVVVACDQAGNVDVGDLRAKAQEYNERIAAIMITYPSTHGVFEEAVTEICEIVHSHGGQVYIDGANLNAQVGLCSPGRYGGDVSHFNLHKTFCIPHGGGGPGVGPIGVGAHLAPFLPSRAVLESPGPERVGPVSGAPWGSAGILPISWMYIAMMGDAGLTEASRVAILSANYVATRLASHYPILYSGPHGRVAHECIIDLRPLKEATGITVDDVAKRLIDYGFHAPTMSFPVAGTLMIEPTESEPKSEIDRFCEAMISIREEIRAVENGSADATDNPLKNAPHTVDMVTAEEWTHPYSREQAAFPVASLRRGKYWSPVGRIDNAYGDRVLFCSCPPFVSEDQDQAA